MKPETREALEASIEHWKHNLYLALQGKRGLGGIQIGGGSCALCKRFSKDCILPGPVYEQCPVEKATGHSLCKFSPYDAVRYDLRMALSARNDEMPECIRRLQNSVRRELDFLKSLLPDDSAKE